MLLKFFCLNVRRCVCFEQQKRIFNTLYLFYLRRFFPRKKSLFERALYFMTNAASPSPLPSKKTPLSVLGFSYDFTVLNASLLVFGIVSGFLVYYKRHALFSRIKTAAHLVPSHFRRRLELKGVALFVTDGDNLRFFHTPLTWRFCSQAKLLKFAKNNIKDETINIRLAGIDAPEVRFRLFRNLISHFIFRCFCRWHTLDAKDSRMQPNLSIG